jgi:hypothetical protein
VATSPSEEAAQGGYTADQSARRSGSTGQPNLDVLQVQFVQRPLKSWVGRSGCYSSREQSLHNGCVGADAQGDARSVPGVALTAAYHPVRSTARPAAVDADIVQPGGVADPCATNGSGG